MEKLIEFLAEYWDGILTAGVGVLAVVFIIVAIWTGDDRWGGTGAILIFVSFIFGMVSIGRHAR